MQLCFASSRYLTNSMYVYNIILSEYSFQDDFHQKRKLIYKTIYRSLARYDFC